MRRKKVQETTDDPAKFWPVPGVDGEPYPPRVQEALDLVEKETRRRKRAECEHKNRRFQATAAYYYYYYSGDTGYRRKCLDCGADVACEHPESAQRRESVRQVRFGKFREEWKCRCGHRTYRDLDTGSHSRALPVMVTVKEAGRQAGMFEQSMVRALRQELEELEEETEELLWYNDAGQLRGSIESVRSLRDWERIRQRNNAHQELRKDSPYVVSKPEDMSWIRTTKKR